MGALRLHISYVIVFIIPTGGYLRLWSIKPTLRMLHHEFGGQGTSVNKKRVRRGLHMHPSPRSSVHAHTVGFLVFLVYTTPSFALPHTATVHHDFTSASPIPWSPMPLVSLLGRISLHLLMDSTCFAPTWVNPVDTSRHYRGDRLTHIHRRVREVVTRLHPVLSNPHHREYWSRMWIFLRSHQSLFSFWHQTRF